MVYYLVSPDYSVPHYLKACKYIESLFTKDEIVKKDLLLDVDGSQIQTYLTPKGEVTVINAFDYDWLFVRSEFEIHNPEWKLWEYPFS